MITTINEFKQTLNESNLNKNMTFNIHGIIYTISRVEGNLIHATDNKGNKKMFNAKYLLDDGIKFEKPKRIMSLRKPILSSKQFEDLIKSAVSNPDSDEEYDYSQINDIAQSLIHDEALKNYLKKLYEQENPNWNNKPYTQEDKDNIRDNDLLSLLVNQLEMYA